MIIPTDMPAEYKDYGYWNVPYFQQKASAVGPSTRALIDAVIRKYAYPVQSFRSCFVILRYAGSTVQRHWKAAVKMPF